ncbi:MAG: MarR family transcriptional regulator, partial [Actinomycetota bacterium]|nr:MarR family transcriptional regulator [Actinomycetota bacterium]
MAQRRGASPLNDDVSFLLARANALSLAAGNAALAVYGLRVRSYSVLALA